MEKFKSQIMEPQLVVFIDDGSLSQMILCAKNQEIAETPGKKLVDGLFHLLASYYVYGVAYPKGWKGAQPFVFYARYLDGKTRYTRPNEKQADTL